MSIWWSYKGLDEGRIVKCICVGDLRRQGLGGFANAYSLRPMKAGRLRLDRPEQGADVARPGKQQAGRPDASNDKAVTLHRSILRRNALLPGRPRFRRSGRDVRHLANQWHGCEPRLGSTRGRHDRAGGGKAMEGQMKAPVHLWIAGVLAALWNGFGALDYTMTQMSNPAWMAQMSEAQVAWLEAAPWWAHGSWALGVWAGLLGSILLLARNRHAVAAFALSLAGLAVNTLHQLTAPMPSGHADSGGAIAFHVVIWAVAIALLVYALRMRKRGILR